MAEAKNRMKKAKQWQQELAGETSVQSIKEIQLDAWRDGMMEAAAVVQSLDGDDVFEPVECIKRACAAKTKI